MVLTGAPKYVTDRLQRVMNAAARQVSGTHKYDHGLSQLLHGDLHWLDMADRVQYKLGATFHWCLHNKAPQYLADCCVVVSELAGRQRLRSAHAASSAGCAALSAKYIRSPSILCCQTHCLELTAG